METMLSALNNSENLKIKELAVSAIGAIGKNSSRRQEFCPNSFPDWIKLKCFIIISANAAKELLVPYFSPVIESLKGFLTSVTEEMRSLQIQSLGRLVGLSVKSINMYPNHKCYCLNGWMSFVCAVAFRHSVCARPHCRQRCLQPSCFRVCSTGPQPGRHHWRSRLETVHVCSFVLARLVFSVNGFSSMRFPFQV